MEERVPAGIRSFSLPWERRACHTADTETEGHGEVAEKMDKIAESYV